MAPLFLIVSILCIIATIFATVNFIVAKLYAAAFIIVAFPLVLFIVYFKLSSRIDPNHSQEILDMTKSVCGEPFNENVFDEVEEFMKENGTELSCDMRGYMD